MRFAIAAPPCCAQLVYTARCDNLPGTRPTHQSLDGESGPTPLTTATLPTGAQIVEQGSVMRAARVRKVRPVKSRSLSPARSHSHSLAVSIIISNDAGLAKPSTASPVHAHISTLCECVEDAVRFDETQKAAARLKSCIHFRSDSYPLLARVESTRPLSPLRPRNASKTTHDSRLLHVFISPKPKTTQLQHYM